MAVAPKFVTVMVRSPVEEGIDYGFPGRLVVHYQDYSTDLPALVIRIWSIHTLAHCLSIKVPKQRKRPNSVNNTTWSR